jgi:starvation-inducible outer membrane lipoprotein
MLGLLAEYAVRVSKAGRSMHCTAPHRVRHNLRWTGVVLNALVVRTASMLAHVHRALRSYARPSAHCGKQEPKP